MRYRIWSFIPHRPKPFRPGPIDGYMCRRCGSRAARVQLAGHRMMERKRKKRVR